MSAAPQVVVGGSIAALVAADQLARSGRAVELHLPERGVGGGFAPLRVDGRRLELGARLIELSYDGEVAAPPPLDQYRPGPHGHRPYLALIDRFVRELAGDDLVALPPPEASVGGKRTGDYVLEGDLSGLAAVVDDTDLALMASQAAACVEREGPHGLFGPDRVDELWARTYDDVGRAHAGDAFHDRFLAPLVDKILSDGGDSVVAALHRKVWLPLFHPVTVWEACTGRLTYRPERPMWSLRNGGMGEIVERLIGRVEASDLIHIERSGGLGALARGPGADEVVFGFGDQSSLLARRPIVGLGADGLFAAAGVSLYARRVDATMIWLDVPEAQVVRLPSVLFVAEPELAPFRITENVADPRPGHRTLCCELDHRCDDPDQWLALAAGALVQLGVVTSEAAVEQVAAVSRPAYFSPSPVNLARFDAARRDYEARGLGAVVVGGALAFGADTFNEQVIQGLAAAEAVSR